MKVMRWVKGFPGHQNFRKIKFSCELIPSTSLGLIERFAATDEQYGFVCGGRSLFRRFRS